MPPPRSGPVHAVAERVGKWLTDVEFRLRVARPFAWGKGAPRVFYPGCSLTAADPALVMRAYEWLRARDPNVELWSDCCGMPLEKFGTPEAAARGRDRTRAKIRESGTREIITACGNCTVQFDKLEVPGLRITSLYGLLAEEDWGPRADATPTIVHHPCSARVDPEQQTHFRKLAGRLHLNVVNLDETKHPLACCLVKTPAAMKKREAIADQQLVTYCAHCTMAFQGDVPTRHILQETFGTPGERWQPRGKVSRFLQYARFSRLATERFGAGAPGGEPAPALARARTALAAVGALAAVALAGFGARELDLARRALELAAWSRGAGPAGVVLYALAYVLATVLLLPGSALTLAAGFAWGPVWGVALVSPVSVLASTAAFLLGRTLLRARVEARVGRDPRVAAIDRAIGDDGLRLVLLLRLSPVLPFNLLNVALALTRVRLRDYVLGSAIGMLPGTVLYVYLGSLATTATELLAGRRPAGDAGVALTLAGLAATLAAVVLVTRASRRALRRALEREPA
jgi:uncharacterized membrane protein YdjX (TVP38/TMEM64 family)